MRSPGCRRTAGITAVNVLFSEPTSGCVGSVAGPFRGRAVQRLPPASASHRVRVAGAFWPARVAITSTRTRVSLPPASTVSGLSGSWATTCTQRTRAMRRPSPLALPTLCLMAQGWLLLRWVLLTWKLSGSMAAMRPDAGSSTAKVTRRGSGGLRMNGASCNFCRDIRQSAGVPLW